MHKGFIDDKLRPGLKAQPVAVKLLDLDGSQGHKEWLVSTLFPPNINNQYVGIAVESQLLLLQNHFRNKCFLSSVLTLALLVFKWC